MKTTFTTVVQKLGRFYGRPKPPEITDALEIILFENVAYLASDEKRAAAFAALKKKIGTSPAQILKASHAELEEITRMGGIAATLSALDRSFQLVVADGEEIVLINKRWPVPPEWFAVSVAFLVFALGLWWMRERRMAAQRNMVRTFFALGVKGMCPAGVRLPMPTAAWTRARESSSVTPAASKARRATPSGSASSPSSRCSVPM